jgi:3'-phosphoadenosine 5'-phosphosulfate sulfotransferase (PAPS reductase)/FAD synthetase
VAESWLDAPVATGVVDLQSTGLVATDQDVARLSRPQREDRVTRLLEVSHQLVDYAIREHITDAGKTHVGTAVLYSGGNDSTTLAHIFRQRATHAIHANTGIGVEATREFVRETCDLWGLPLIEKHPPTSFRDLVLDQGFPGPAHHYKMYQRLKERCLRQARRDLVANGRKQRVVFLAGRRREESARRASVPEMERDGAVVWVSPLVLWTKLDLNTYRLMMQAVGDDVPRNKVSDLIHMSGECLCGSFAHAGELEEIGEWFPEVRAEIEALEAEVLATGKHPEWRCRWGWGADKDVIQKLRKQGMPDAEIAALFERSTSGPLCSSCDSRADGGTVISGGGS